MKNVILFVLGVAISCAVFAQVGTTNTKPAATTKAEVILGHRIGPNGEEMLVTK